MTKNYNNCECLDGTCTFCFVSVVCYVCDGLGKGKISGLTCHICNGHGRVIEDSLKLVLMLGELDDGAKHEIMVSLMREYISNAGLPEFFSTVIPEVLG